MKRSNKNKWIWLTLTLTSFLYGCQKNPTTPDYQKEITVFGYLYGNEKLTSEHAILIAYTQPILKYYELNQAAIRGAVVTLREADTGLIYQLKDTPEKPGFYFNDSLLVKPKTTYHLRVEVDGKVVTASTMVPPILKVTTKLRQDTINYVYPKNLSREMPIYLECESIDQIVLVDMYCNESYKNAEYITPFLDHKYPADQEEYDGGKDGEPRHITAFAKLKDFISEEYPGQYVVFWYSSMIVFYGSYTMQVLAIDDNYHKFLYTEHPEYSSGVKGGIGVFGSVCGATFQLVVQKP